MVISKREIMSGPTGKESEMKPKTNKKRASQALYIPISQRKKLESASSVAENNSNEAKPDAETKRRSTSERSKSTDERIEQESQPKLDQNFNDSGVEVRRSKKTSSKKKSQTISQHDDRVEVESNSKTKSPKIDKRVTRSMATKQESKQNIGNEPNRAERKSPKSQKKPKSELESMQDGLDRLVIINRNAKSKSNRDSNRNDTRDAKSSRKSTDRKPFRPMKESCDQKELRPGHSKWFPGDSRPDWTRPCFKDFEHVIIGDSQLKIYGQQQKEKKGFSITSFSGCDLLEFLNVLRVGFLSCERDRRGDVAILSRTDIRKEYGLGRSKFAIENCCEYCGENCLLKFDGNLVLAFGLNNSLKAENKSFDGQDISFLFQMIDETIKEMLPKLKSVYFVPAIRVEREDWIHSIKCQKAFKIVNKEVESRNHSSISADLAHQKGWIGEDGVHLHKNNAIKYWEDNFKDIQFQIDI